MTYRRSQRGIARLTAIVIGVILAVGGASAATKPDDCLQPPLKGPRWTWEQGARVSVTIDPQFIDVPGGYQALVEALRRWESAGSSDGNGSGVTFDVLDFGTAPPVGPTLRLSRGTLRTGGQARTSLWSASGSLVRASCVIDERVTNPLAILQVAVHEIGHTFGLAECDECGYGSSVMTRSSGVDYNDTTSGAGWPSECDNAAVRENGGY